MRALLVTVLCATLPLAGCQPACADGSEPGDDGACPPADSGGTPGDGSPYCRETVTGLGWDEAAPNGTVPSSFRPNLESAADDTLTWGAGGTTPVHVSSAVSGSPEWVERVVIDPQGGGSTTVGRCESAVRIGLTVELVTDDGALDEALDAAWEDAPVDPWSTEAPADGVAIVVYLPVDAVGGTWSPAAADPADDDSLELRFSLMLASGTTDGDVYLLEQVHQGGFVTVEDVAHW